MLKRLLLVASSLMLLVAMLTPSITAHAQISLPPQGPEDILKEVAKVLRGSGGMVDTYCYPPKETIAETETFAIVVRFSNSAAGIRTAIEGLGFTQITGEGANTIYDKWFSAPDNPSPCPPPSAIAATMAAAGFTQTSPGRFQAPAQLVLQPAAIQPIDLTSLLVGGAFFGIVALLIRLAFLLRRPKGFIPENA